MLSNNATFGFHPIASPLVLHKVDIAIAVHITCTIIYADTSIHMHIIYTFRNISEVASLLQEIFKANISELLGTQLDVGNAYAMVTERLCGIICHKLHDIS